MRLDARSHARGLRRAFTFLEVMVVVVIIGILAAIVVPQFGTATSDAKASALKTSVGGWRAGIAAFRTRAVASSGTEYPTLTQLTTLGTVVSAQFPENPYNGLTNAQAVTQTQAQNRTVVSPMSYGWNYYYDNTSNPPTAIFYANSSDTVETINGTPRTANQY